MKQTRLSRLRIALTASTMLTAGALLLAGCSSVAATGQTQDAAGSVQDAPQARQGTPPGVSGLIAAASDGELQVQGSDQQTTVRYTDSTSVTKSVTVDAAAIAVGDCVLIMTGDDGTTATTVTVTEATDGTCTAGPGSGERPEGMPSGAPSDGERPEGMPSGAPSDMPSGDRPGGFISGAVTDVSAGALTVDARAFGADGDTTSTEITLADDTVITGTAAGTLADLAVGTCVTARGEADDAGGYDATSLAVSDPNDEGDCSAGFGGFRGGPGAPGDAGAQGDEDGGSDD